MSMKRNILIIMSYLSLCTLWADEYEVAPYESWVEPVKQEFAEEYDEYIEDGEFYHLYENQILLEDNRVAQFRHYVIEMTNLNGVESNSQISIDFDPAYETLTIHNISLIRDGEVIDRLDSADTDIFNRETDMDRLLYDGTKTFHAILKDVRPGDILDYSYTLEGMNPVFDNKFSRTLWLEWSIPVGRVYYRVIHKRDTPLNIRYTNEEVEADIFRLKERGTEYIWDHNALISIDWESGIPDWYNPLKRVELTEFDSWSELKSWAKELFVQDFPKDQLEGIYDSLVTDSMSREEKLFTIVQWVQDEIRYLGLESGIDSHKPTTPDITLDRRFGDCKDKSFMTVELLNMAGIESWPVLVDTESGKTVNESLPMTGLFDHVIIATRLNRELMWIDPTDSYQRGGQNTFYQPNYYYALVLDDTENIFQSMDSGPMDVAGQHFLYEIDVREEEPTFVVSCINRFDDADYMRYKFDSGSHREINEGYRDYYMDYYDDIYIDNPIEIIDDETENRFTTLEKYRVPGFWLEDEESDDREINIYAIDLSDYINKPEDTRREMPLELNYPTYVTQTIKVKFDKKQGAYNEDSFNLSSEYIEYNFDSKYEDDTLINNFSFKVLKDHVPPEDMEAYLKDIDAILDNLEYSYYTEFFDNPLDTIELDSDTNYLPYIIIIVLVILLIRSNRKDNKRGYY